MLDTEYHKFKLPSLDDESFFKEKISDKLTERIWNDDNNDRIHKYDHHINNKGSLNETFLRRHKLKIPIFDSSKLLLIQNSLYKKESYNSIVSIQVANLPYNIDTEFYEVSYEKKNRTKIKNVQGRNLPDIANPYGYPY